MNKNISNNIVNKRQERPSFVPSLEDIQSVHVGKFKFYPEDIKKMEQMSTQEAREYSANLVMKNKYIKD